jgi:ribosome hibernation promoting factor
MQLSVTGRGVELESALRGHIAERLGAILGRYFGSAIEAHVVFSKEAHLDRADISLHIGRRILVNAAASAPDLLAAFDAAAERLGKQLRRSKRRLRDHRAHAEDAEIGSAGSPGPKA